MGSHKLWERWVGLLGKGAFWHTDNTLIPRIVTIENFIVLGETFGAWLLRSSRKV